MRYLFAVIFPPLGVLLCGKPIQFLLSIPLTLCFYVPGIIHALCVVSSYEAENRTNKIVRAIKDSDRAATIRSEHDRISSGNHC